MALSAETKDIVITTSPKETIAPVDTVDVQSMSITEPPPPKIYKSTQLKPADLYYNQTSSLAPRFGLGVSTGSSSTESLYYLLGIQYMLPSEDEKHLEGGVDFFSNNTTTFHLGHKWMQNPHSAFRTYYKLAVALSVNPKEELATFTQLDNYQIRPSFGIEDAVSANLSIRVDVEAFFNFRKQGLFVAVGYCWGF